ncbi:hypothetical protein FA95DRAFT_1610932 [Auriscalpium vulgare]|uniref:Uncharacterized protein n=1 Tax=Auriscalpium vulgare TaxID=40419 RepID=A0ACB8RBK9_9AGAM|nr:hypothetical protein FA95DRAFT_1610932 [Auriscalpium vulgare]
MAPHTRGWWRAHFYDHPLLPLKAPEAYADTRKDKAKVACKACFDTRVADEHARDEAELQSGARGSTRDSSAIQSTLWSIDLPPAGRIWLSSRSSTLINHLRHCSHQTLAVQQRAEEEFKLGSPSRRSYGQVLWQQAIPFPGFGSAGATSSNPESQDLYFSPATPTSMSTSNYPGISTPAPSTFGFTAVPHSSTPLSRTASAVTLFDTPSPSPVPTLTHHR